MPLGAGKQSRGELVEVPHEGLAERVAVAARERAARVAVVRPPIALEVPGLMHRDFFGRDDGTPGGRAAGSASFAA